MRLFWGSKLVAPSSQRGTISASFAHFIIPLHFASNPQIVIYIQKPLIPRQLPQKHVHFSTAPGIIIALGVSTSARFTLITLQCCCCPPCIACLRERALSLSLSRCVDTSQTKFRRVLGLRCSSATSRTSRLCCCSAAALGAGAALPLLPGQPLSLPPSSKLSSERSLCISCMLSS